MEVKLPSSPIIAFENSAVPAGLDPISPEPGVETPGYCQSPLRGSGQNVGRSDVGAERAGRNIANFPNHVNAAGWTFRKIALRIEFDKKVITFAFNIRPDVVYRNNVVTLCIVLQRPFIFCRINLA